MTYTNFKMGPWSSWLWRHPYKWPFPTPQRFTPGHDKRFKPKDTLKSNFGLDKLNFVLSKVEIPSSNLGGPISFFKNKLRTSGSNFGLSLLPYEGWSEATPFIGKRSKGPYLFLKINFELLVRILGWAFYHMKGGAKQPRSLGKGQRAHIFF